MDRRPVAHLPMVATVPGSHLRLVVRLALLAVLLLSLLRVVVSTTSRQGLHCPLTASQAILHCPLRAAEAGSPGNSLNSRSACFS